MYVPRSQSVYYLRISVCYVPHSQSIIIIIYAVPVPKYIIMFRDHKAIFINVPIPKYAYIIICSDPERILLSMFLIPT